MHTGSRQKRQRKETTMNFREAMLQARSGKTVTRAGKIIRHLTKEEGDAHQFTYNRSRRSKMGEDGKALVENGQIVVEEYGDVGPRPQRLGLFDVSQNDEHGHALSYTPTEDDVYEPVELDEEGKEKPRVFRSDWELVAEASKEEPEVVSPDDVEKALMETEPPGDLNSDLEGAPHDQ